MTVAGRTSWGIFDENKLADVLQLPEGQIVGGLVAMGYPAESPEPPSAKVWKICSAYL